MNAYDELTTTATVGPATYELFLGKARSAARRFPPPDGAAGWNLDALAELAHEVFASKGPALTLTLLEATSQTQLEKLVWAILDNFLKDQAKSTPRGKLRRRLAGILDKDRRFARSAHSSWRMSTSPDTASRLTLEDLFRAADAVRDVVLTELNPAGPTSRANRDALLAVMVGVLTAADGPVREEDLARAVEHRFQLAVSSILQPEFSDGTWTAAAGPVGFVGDTEDRRIAQALWDGLSHRERHTIDYLSEQGPDGLAAHLRCGPKQAKVVLRHVRAAIGAAAPDGKRRFAVTVELTAIANGHEFGDAVVTSSEPHDGPDSGPLSQGRDR